MSNGRKTLKRRLFKRDGWQIINPYEEQILWVAWCSFGCGALLTYETATIDHYPVPRRLGGGATLNNTRLACFLCNSHDGGAAGAASRVVPKGLSPMARRRWWQDNHKRLLEAGIIEPSQGGPVARKALHHTPA